VSLTVPAAPSSLLAVATTVHLGLASLRNHRRLGAGPVSSLAVVSTLLAALPWLFPSVTGLAFGFGLHAAWFAVCERFVHVPSRVPAAGDAAPADGPRPDPVLASPPWPSCARPRGFIPVPVLAVIDEAVDVRTFRFARPDGFDFIPGQFLTVRVRADGRDHARCYSISSPPEARGLLDITVKRQGLVSGTLHATLRPGMVVPVKAPAGVFRYPADDDRPLLLLAGGIGITPLFSMLRHATQAEPSRAVTLLYSAQTEAHLAFRDELEAVARRHPQIRTVFAVTRAAPAPGIYPGRIDESLVRATMPNVADAIALLCGPQPMIDGLRALLAGLGVPVAQIRSEVFEAAVAASGGHHADAADAGAAAHQMHCARSGADVRVDARQTLLDAAEAGGISIDSLCRSGVCGTCRTRVIDGDVRCESALLDDTDRADGYVLACISHALGDCTVDL
jgi:ferredoxin-NADP reductase